VEVRCRNIAEAPGSSKKGLYSEAELKGCSALRDWASTVCQMAAMLVLDPTFEAHMPSKQCAYLRTGESE
jgi:hypothetical protein